MRGTAATVAAHWSNPQHITYCSAACLQQHAVWNTCCLPRHWVFFKHLDKVWLVVLLLATRLLGTYMSTTLRGMIVLTWCSWTAQG